MRARNDWSDSVSTVERGFNALGARLESVVSYTDETCMRCGSCLQGCPTNSGASTQNTWIQRAIVRHGLELRAGCGVERVVIEDSPAGRRRPASSTSTPTAARRDRRRRGRRRGRHAQHARAARPLGLRGPARRRDLGFHPARLVFGLFDELQDAHVVYPITAHCAERRHDADGGYVIEAVTMQDPIGFATTVEDEDGPLWGEPLVEVLRHYRRWTGVLAMANDDNGGTVIPGASRDDDAYSADFTAGDIGRIDGALRFSRDVFEAAGAERRCSGRGSSRPTCRAAAGWDRTPSVPSSTPTPSATRSAASSSATPRRSPAPSRPTPR